MADPQSVASPSCSVCFRPMTVTAAGLIRQHGPLCARCPGSRLILSPLRCHSQRHVVKEPSIHLLLLLVFPCLPRWTSSVKILKRIPKASRLLAGRKLASILEAIVGKNDHDSWDRLFRFSSRCLRATKRGGQRRSLATVVNRQLEEESDLSDSIDRPCTKQRQASSRDPIESLAARISAKLKEGDFGRVVRLGSLDDTLAPHERFHICGPPRQTSLTTP
jgi:hypothetical protein